MKGKIDLIVIDDREYDNQFTEFTPYFEKALKNGYWTQYFLIRIIELWGR